MREKFAATGHFPLIRRVPRHLPPKGKAFAAGCGHPARDITSTRKYRVACRGGIYAARAAIRTLRHNGQTAPLASPFGGSCRRSRLMREKFAAAGYFPLIRRVPRHLPPKGKAFAAGWGHPARDITSTRKYRVACRGGIYAARCSHPDIATQRANRIFGFPLWGKLSPQVTDEGEICSCRTFPPHPARSAPPSPQGEGFPSGAIK